MPKLNNNPLWLVRNASVRHELEDVLWKVSFAELIPIAIGMGLDAWHMDQCAIYDNEAEALADARGRMLDPVEDPVWVVAVAPGFAGISEDARELGRYRSRTEAMIAGETIRRHGSEETRRARLALWAEKRGHRIDDTWREIP